MSEQVKDYPPYLDYPKPRKKQTNGDKIRQMSDEKLIANFKSGICCIIQETDHKWCKDQGSCEECQREWLKKEVST